MAVELNGIDGSKMFKVVQSSKTAWAICSPRPCVCFF